MDKLYDHQDFLLYIDIVTFNRPITWNWTHKIICRSTAMCDFWTNNHQFQMLTIRSHPNFMYTLLSHFWKLVVVYDMLMYWFIAQRTFHNKILYDHECSVICANVCPHEAPHTFLGYLNSQCTPLCGLTGPHWQWSICMRDMNASCCDQTHGLNKFNG